MFLPSFAGALLYLTVLSFSGQMITWLLSEGYDSTQIAISRTFSVAFEVLATWIAPWLMGKIGPIRAGIWLANWQIACLACGTAVFWKFADSSFLSASGLVGGTILSRVGLRGFDLCSQILVQEVSAFLSINQNTSLRQTANVKCTGRGSYGTRVILFHRSSVAKPIRDPIVHFHDSILPAG